MKSSPQRHLPFSKFKGLKGLILKNNLQIPFSGFHGFGLQSLLAFGVGHLGAVVRRAPSALLFAQQPWLQGGVLVDTNEVAFQWVSLTQLPHQPLQLNPTYICSFCVSAVTVVSHRVPPCRHTSLKVCTLGSSDFLQVTCFNDRIPNCHKAFWQRFGYFLKARKYVFLFNT